MMVISMTQGFAQKKCMLLDMIQMSKSCPLPHGRNRDIRGRSLDWACPAGEGMAEEHWHGMTTQAWRNIHFCFLIILLIQIQLMRNGCPLSQSCPDVVHMPPRACEALHSNRFSDILVVPGPQASKFEMTGASHYPTLGYKCNCRRLSATWCCFCAIVRVIQHWVASAMEPGEGPKNGGPCVLPAELLHVLHCGENQNQSRLINLANNVWASQDLSFTCVGRTCSSSRWGAHALSCDISTNLKLSTTFTHHKRTQEHFFFPSHFDQFCATHVG